MLDPYFTDGDIEAQCVNLLSKLAIDAELKFHPF